MITILIADDDAANLELLSDALEAPGYRIIDSSDGHDALLKVQAERTDMVLVDIQMPGLDGFEVLRAIRTLEPPVPMSCSSVDGLRDGRRPQPNACIRLDGYIAKPVSISHVREQVGADAQLFVSFGRS